MALQEDKHNYETTAKESLRRVLQEKIEVVRKLSEVEVGDTNIYCTQCLLKISQISQALSFDKSKIVFSFLLACSAHSVTQRMSAPT